MGIFSKCDILVHRYDGGHYFTAISTENGQSFSPILNFCLPFFSRIGYVVTNSCNGVLCLEDHRDGNLPEGESDAIVLWNPSNDVAIKIPDSDVQRPSSAFASDFCVSGFGFDSKTVDYKVIRLVENYLDDDYEGIKLQADLYSLTRNYWKEVFLPDPLIEIDYGRSTYIDGVSYWPAWNSNNKLFILSFDFSSEKFYNLCLPDDISEFSLSNANFLDLLDCNGLPAVIFYPIKGESKSFDIWVPRSDIHAKDLRRKEGKTSWNRLYEISFRNRTRIKRPLGFWKIDEIFFEGSNGDLLLYDTAKGTWKHLGIIDTGRNEDWRTTMHLIPYVQSSMLEEFSTVKHQWKAPLASAPPPALASASTSVSVSESAPVASSTAASESDLNYPKRAVEYLSSLQEQPPSKAPRAYEENVLHFLEIDGKSKDLSGMF